MITTLRKQLFYLYERRLLRNWVYTLAFAIFVPVGFRFALLAWDFGNGFDRVMAVIAGLAVGFTMIMTLVRIWAVAPKQTLAPESGSVTETSQTTGVDATELIAAVRACSIRNQQLARGARALGTPRSLYH